MTEPDWEEVEEVEGELQAELLRGLLEAQGIPVFLFREGAGLAYGINVGPLGQVQILVPTKRLVDARQVLDDYYAGKFEDIPLEGMPEEPEQEDEEE